MLPGRRAAGVCVPLAPPALLAALALVVVLALLAGCGAGAGDDGDAERDAAVYAEVVRAMTGDRVEEGAPVFVAHADDEVIDLEVQVGVIQRLGDEADVRFVDRREDAVDGDDPDAPVRDDGVLVVVGPVRSGDGEVEVTVEVYEERGRDESRQLLLRPDDGGWVVAGERPAGGGR